MKLKVGDLVQHIEMPHIWGTVILVATTQTDNDVCEVIVNYNKLYPQEVGRKRYLNQCYWKKLPRPHYLESGGGDS
jgi:hypothetical protein